MLGISGRCARLEHVDLQVVVDVGHSRRRVCLLGRPRRYGKVTRCEMGVERGAVSECSCASAERGGNQRPPRNAEHLHVLLERDWGREIDELTRLDTSNPCVDTEGALSAAPQVMTAATSHGKDDLDHYDG